MLWLKLAAYNGVFQENMMRLFSLPVIRWFPFKRLFEYASISTPALARRLMGAGRAASLEDAARPLKPLKLYEFEACPFCRKVRETISILDLNVIVYPCPRETMKVYGYMKDSRFRPVVQGLGGKLAFPYLVDDNTGMNMYESADIVKYLWERYGGKTKKPYCVEGVPPALNMSTLMFSTFMRPLPTHGMQRLPSRDPGPELIQLWGYETDVNSRLIREALTSLEQPYLYRNVAPGTAKLDELKTLSGSTIVPYFFDPNTKFSSTDGPTVVKYLLDTYQVGEANLDSLFNYGTGKAEEKKSE
eukprot:TRINITY_DN16922_c0_g1::TRINITY_DN16922_c0_g1_i1::g.29662::m.29662 TRINITY_DN16922_c0_g1::TRINITY_DN16922_c0_g1_i1::g.29662  ORF type:complete len:302 (-),score=59.16,GST_N_3/PF13417.1/4e-11,GST_N_3/PF13417.1/0.0081,GST_N_2/PF13409.1/0.00018,GST_N_2/PF13409.1/25,Glutaredoxin/PF00462.19/0.26,Glutaredoxin/PF00462.19/0.52 TRINITY_DN16922_c0_g1_i1:209-1114(-)